MHIFNYDSVIHRHGMKHPDCTTTSDHNYSCDLTTNQPIIYTTTAIPNDYIQQNTTLQPICSIEKEHSHTKARVYNCSDSVVFFVFPSEFITVPTVWYFLFFHQSL